MKKMILLLLLSLGLAMHTAAFAGNRPSTTVMVYMCGSNLESQYSLATSDIFEMAFSGFRPGDTNVMLMLGGSSRWEMNGYDPRQSRIIRLMGPSPVEIWSGDSMNMGSGETLSFFLDTVCRTVQSDRYILILWDHGAGPLGGVCRDENHDNDTLLISELIEGIQNSPFAQKKLDMIGFDACLMGSVETAWQLAPYADYMVASEETEPGSGWDYSFLGGIGQDETMAETGKRIVDGYIGSFPENYGSVLTLSCTDLSRIGAVVDSMDMFFSELDGMMTHSVFQDLSALRRYAKSFGSDFRIQENTDYDLVDIRSLLEPLKKYGLQSWNKLEEALDQAVVYSRSNEEGSFGLSVYFPYFNEVNYLKYGEAFYQKNDFCQGYQQYIKTFMGYMKEDVKVSWEGLVPVVAKNGDGFDITVALTPQQRQEMVAAKLVILRADYSPGCENTWYRNVYSSANTETDESGVLRAAYQNESVQIYYTDPEGVRKNAPIVFSALESGEYQVDLLAGSGSGSDFIMNALPDAPGISHWMRLTLAPPDESGIMKIRSVQVYDSVTGTYTTRADDSLDRYAYINWKDDLRLIQKEDGVNLAYECWPERRGDRASMSALASAVNDGYWYLAAKQQTEGIQYAAFEITDSQNNTFMTELTPLRSFEDITFEKSEFEIQNLPLSMEIHCLAYGEHSVMTWINVTNLDEEEVYSFLISNVRTNGRFNEKYFYRPVYNELTGELISIYSEAGGDLIDAVWPQEKVSMYVHYEIPGPGQEEVPWCLESLAFDLDVCRGNILDFRSPLEYIGTIENITVMPGVDFRSEVFSENFGAWR